MKVKKSQKDLKEEIIGEVEKIIIFLVQSIKTQQIQNVTQQYQQQDATISSAVPTNGATDTTTAGLNIKVNKKKRPTNNLKSKFNKKQGIPSTIQPYKKKIVKHSRIN